MEHFYQNLEGEKWFDYEGVYKDAVLRAKDGARFVELGAWKGHSSVFMAVEIINSGKRITFDTIDNWSQGETRDEFIKNIEPVSGWVYVITAVSWEAAKFYEDRSIDFLFIDAAHDKDSKVKDIKAWLPKIKHGGVMAGHDYTPDMDDYNRTYEAVNETLGKENISVIKNVWVYEKP